MISYAFNLAHCFVIIFMFQDPVSWKREIRYFASVAVFLQTYRHDNGMLFKNSGLFPHTVVSVIAIPSFIIK